MAALPASTLPLSRACAWALLVGGWIGIGSLALQLAPSAWLAFGLVAAWLVGLGAAARLGTRRGMPSSVRAVALVAATGATAASLLAAVEGGGVVALLVAIVGWAAMTALASGVVRGLRLARSTAPAPPVAAATVGALAAAAAIGDPGQFAALGERLALFVGAGGLLLLVLQRGIVDSPRGAGCRAGLFDCSLPAWPPGAWGEPQQWPALFAGLGMLPMMAALPLMAEWCRARSVPPQALVVLHVASMFVPALLARRAIAVATPRALAVACTVLLVAGAACAVRWAAPFDLLAPAALQGAAWGMAWSGQLWSPTRRARQGASPLRAAIGYAACTLAYGAIVDRFGPAGIVGVHVALAVAASCAWVLVAIAVAARRGARAGDRPTAPDAPIMPPPGA
ncbi:MAG TPA: hypothetical protein VMU33_15660 [Burkholderiaceae bacterium]|nr:hypothetical protein [Burkholderiaceae bacterium]